MFSISQDSFIQTIEQYLLQYRSLFKKRSFNIFLWLVFAIISVEEVRSIRFLHEIFIKKYGRKVLNSLYYLLSYVHFPSEELIKVTVGIGIALIPDNLKHSTVFLTIVDTLQTKYSFKGSENLALRVYVIRWNMKVIFYQHKFFWGFSNYMVRNKLAIERYVNLLAIGFTLVCVLPFLDQRLKAWQFESPQAIKREISRQIHKELILDSFVSSLENSKIDASIEESVKCYLQGKKIA